jgi:hypothetical protein
MVMQPYFFTLLLYHNPLDKQNQRAFHRDHISGKAPTLSHDSVQWIGASRHYLASITIA